MKNHNIHKTIILASLLAASQTSLAESSITWVKAPQMKTLPSLQQTKAATATQWQQQPVQYNIDAIDKVITAAENQGYVAESKSFYMDVNGADLTKGIDIPVASHSAVIRISSMGENIQIDGSQIELSQGPTQISKQVMATGEELNSIGMAVPEHTVAMKINHQPGALRLKLNGLKTANNDRFVIHVLEPESPYRLAMTTSKQLYQAGDTLTVKAELLAADSKLPIAMQGYISRPNGEKYADLKFTTDGDGQMVANLAQLPLASLNDGLWEVHTIAKSENADQTILRDVSSAFAVTVPTAQFNGQLKMTHAEIKLGIDNHMSSRYEASGLLMGHDKTGNAQPIAMLMTADWLSQGEATLSFKLPKLLINKSGLSAPFLVTQLNLKNQSLMAPVQQIDSGFQFNMK
ncbi:DUF4785 domain-containing protein [Marinicella litoralis]|uniref:Uncharacterized protein DUF4785 n=1 Tax=Marinicella litoralis TaxID=644220 RepID=A0A4R6XE26_9GAMM|nr:DUF4785 domain-containing protein [Marinicella litoralis]TDR17562.1 uncharacterized protein DUF4785 [Marinicella litoralis]